MQSWVMTPLRIVMSESADYYIRNPGFFHKTSAVPFTGGGGVTLITRLGTLNLELVALTLGQL